MQDGDHHYALIYDNFQQKWRKYLDENITEMTEEEVLCEASGGNNS